jgi:hypothetical protein
MVIFITISHRLFKAYTFVNQKPVLDVWMRWPFDLSYSTKYQHYVSLFCIRHRVFSTHRM